MRDSLFHNTRSDEFAYDELYDEGGFPPFRQPSFVEDILRRTFFFVFQVVKVLFFSALVFGLAAGACYLIVKERIKGEEIPAPNVAGLSLRDAVEMMHEQGLELSIKMEGSDFSDTVPKGAIISQFPPPEKMIKSGAAIRVMVSKGSSLIECPDLRGMNYVDAGIQLRESELKEGKKSFIAHSDIEKDLVIAQDPAPGESLERQSPVNMLVSLGPAEGRKLMPDLTNLTPPEARIVLEEIGVEISQVLEAPYAGKDNGLIFKQSPPAGSTVTPGDQVRVTIVNNLGQENS